MGVFSNSEGALVRADQLTDDLVGLYRTRGMLASGGIKAGSEAFELAQAQGHNVTTARENSRAASSHFEAEKVKIDAEIDVCMIELRHIDRFLNHSKEASSGKLG